MELTLTPAQQDINTHTATVTSLDFQADFTLSHAASATAPSAPIRALTTWFDTFFSADSKVHAGENVAVDLPQYAANAFARDVAVPEGEAKMVSFTTGPRGQVTHWKQVTFMLKKEVVLQPGTMGCGSRIPSQLIRQYLHCRPIHPGHILLPEVQD